MKINKSILILLVSVPSLLLGWETKGNTPKNTISENKQIVLENNFLKLFVNKANGSFSVIEKTTNQIWDADPWEGAAGLLTLIDKQQKKQTLNISESKIIEATRKGPSTVTIKFKNPVLKNGNIAEGVVINCQLQLLQNEPKLSVQVLNFEKSSYKLVNLRYPSRQFSLKTDIDKGAGVIPLKQGVVCPSYIFPMNGGRFCKWDDATYSKKAIGEIDIHNGHLGLSMPWWGTHTKKSAVIGVVDQASTTLTKLYYNINGAGQHLFNSAGKMSTFPRILFLDPIWNLKNKNDIRKITYEFIPQGNHVHMAKAYRKEAKKKGYLLSLKEKLRRNPNLKKLAGSIYMGVYGGYPHYVNMPGMAFTFKELQEIVKITHDELGVNNAFFHAWGVFSNFVPNCWPISEALGGEKELRKVVDLTKKYGYLYSSYHAYTATLENDPNFSTALMPSVNGKLQKTQSRWGRIDHKHYKSLASKNLEKEIKALDLEADITDIAFVFNPTTGSKELAKYLRSLNLVMGTENGQEFWIPYFDMFEGMTWREEYNLSKISHKAPLFSLVYHDAIATFGKIQDPDNEVTSNGDFRIKSLRNLLYGTGTTIFFSPYEFEGMRSMIKMANQLVSPIHKEVFYDELVKHEYLSSDFKIQKSKFENGTEIMVNLGPVSQTVNKNETIPGYGFKITKKDGTVKRGSFTVSLNMN